MNGCRRRTGCRRSRRGCRHARRRGRGGRRARRFLRLHESPGRRVGRRGGFSADLGPGPLGRGTIRHRPAVVDAQLDNAFPDSARTRHLAHLGNDRDRDLELVSADNSRRFGVSLAAQPISLDRARAAGPQLFVARPLVPDGSVRERDPGDVVRFDHDRQVAFRWNDRAPDMFGPEFVGRDKGILLWTDIVIAVRPILDAAAPIEPRFRRQRSPADIILARPPRDPGRRPFLTRHPDPADAFQANPAPIMVGGPAKRLVGDPGPSRVAVSPAAFGVGPPIAGPLCLAWLPDIPVFVCLPPIAMVLELLVKHSVGRRGALRRAAFLALLNDGG
jgi:hypothetical protein